MSHDSPKSSEFSESVRSINTEAWKRSQQFESIRGSEKLLTGKKAKEWELRAALLAFLEQELVDAEATMNTLKINPKYSRLGGEWKDQFNKLKDLTLPTDHDYSFSE